jgi:N-acetylmuramoyl-L-alanine amidase
MTLRGVNCDPTNPAGGPDVGVLKTLGFNAARVVNKAPAAEQYAAACKKAGLFVMDAITHEADGQLLANADLHEIRNEIDIASPSSEGIIPPADYKQEVIAYAGSNPGLKFVLGSLAAGDYSASYLRSILPVLQDPNLANVIGFSLHPYGKALNEAKTLIAAHQQACRDVLGRELQVFITEWNRPPGEIPGYDWWLRQNTAGAWWFCWSDGMVPGFGLVKPELAAFKPFLSGSAASPPTTPPTTPVLRQWQSGNFWAGRPYGPPIAIVIHTEAGSEAGTQSEFTNNASQVSAHFGVGLDGRADQFVQLVDSAWANGIREAGNSWDTRGLPNVNPNFLSVSIETEDLGNNSQPVTDAQYASVLAIGRLALATFPSSLTWLLRHADISPSTRAHCPGDRWMASGRFQQLAHELGLQTFG